MHLGLEGASMKPVLSLSRAPRFCTSCGSGQVLRSRRRGLLEWFILPLLLLRPFRCSLCNDRHYGFFFRKRVASPPEGGSAASS
jgi:hypothetical protein